MDEDDEQGSRAIPSRTAFGSESAFIEKFPEYGRVKEFFFGLIAERNWGYRCVLTLPQIELMLTDLPHTLFHSKSKTLHDSDVEEANRLQEEANRKAAERRRRKESDEYTIDELFKGVAEQETP